MTIRILGYVIQITRQAQPQALTINREQARKDAEAIKSTAAFAALKAQAQAIRAARA